MALEIECLIKLEGNFFPEEEQKVEKDSLHRITMTRLESLKKSSHFGTVLKNRVINNDFYAIYRKKNFIKKVSNEKKLYISFVMRKKVGNAVKRNRIKRKLKGIVQRMLKANNSINLNYTYIIFGKEKIYSEESNSLFKDMEKSFKKINRE
tara:strand:- start:377 stop:829 length:453 start_codon:yes stop_codon:yes gene_type:complete